MWGHHRGLVYKQDLTFSYSTSCVCPSLVYPHVCLKVGWWVATIKTVAPQPKIHFCGSPAVSLANSPANSPETKLDQTLLLRTICMQSSHVHVVECVWQVRSSEIPTCMRQSTVFCHKMCPEFVNWIVNRLTPSLQGLWCTCALNIWPQNVLTN